MHEGSNTGTIDNFGANQYWMAMVGPGRFKVTFHYGKAHEGLSFSGGKPFFFVGFRETIPGTTLDKPVDFPGGTTWTGSAAKPTKLTVAITPPPGGLVRVAADYTFEATGSVSFSAVEGDAPSVVGVYAVNEEPEVHGIAKFLADGTIKTNTGETGKWELFDAASRVYTVTLGRSRWSLIYSPTHGFNDARTTLPIFTQKH